MSFVIILFSYLQEWQTFSNNKKISLLTNMSEFYNLFIVEYFVQFEQILQQPHSM